MYKMIKSLFRKFQNLNLITHLLISFGLHLFLILFCEIQDRYLEVKYTDIDYIVFTDGARFILNGDSPFSRSTYRYTPLLAWLMTPNIFLFPQFGKLLFSVFDVFGGYLLYKILDSNIKSKYHLLWLYNPLTLILSTRGNAESLICTFVILVIYYFIKEQNIVAGLCFGFIIHFKLYPIIYTSTFYLILSKNSSWFSLISINSQKMVFFISTAIGLLIPSYISYWLYGSIYLEEAWFYHFHRQDLQHNFSPYFYLYQLSDNYSFKKIISMMAFLPQMFFTILIAFYYVINDKKPSNIFISLFLQTYLFVTLNKVITAQYFEWYICLLPLVLPFLQISPLNLLMIFVLWVFSIFQWLLPAYLFEFKKWNCLHWLGYASLTFVFINLYLILYLHYKFIIRLKHLKSNNKDK